MSLPSPAAGVDYVDLVTNLQFSSSGSSLVVPVEIVNDEVVENTDLFVATLTSDVDRVTINPGATSVSILNDDGM